VSASRRPIFRADQRFGGLSQALTCSRATLTSPPAYRVQLPAAMAPVICSGRSVDSSSIVAPPPQRTPPVSSSNRGKINANSGRGTHSNRTSTEPDMQRARRSNTPGEARPRSWPRSWAPNAIASWTTSCPDSEDQVVSNTSPCGKYRRSATASPSAGRKSRYPASSSSSRASTGARSNRGRHNQSTEPARVTNAAVEQSDRNACSPCESSN